ncbi:MAG: hypothetical protein B2I17_04795 [Thermoplasmatales archaeon B_DKE]|nr:MAG: hypothetical protein B2I17_04795 [Thermoplasmatales archaeon B_DKE]
MTELQQKRSITFRHAVAIYMASVLGGGILILPGLAAQVAGSLSIIAWVLLAMASYPFAFTFSRLALINPRSGGIFTFSRDAFGSYVGNGVGWLFLAWVCLGAPAVALAAGSYLSFAIPLTRLEIFEFALVMIIAVAVINYAGIRFSATVQFMVIVAVVGILVLSIATSFFRVSSTNLTQVPAGNDLFSIGTSMALIIWAYFGYENVPNLAGEFVNPKRDIQRSVFYSVVIIGILYTALAIVTVGTGAYLAGGSIAPFSVLMSSVFGRYGAIAAAIVAVVAIFSTMNAYYAGVSKLVQTLAMNDGIPKYFSKGNAHTGSASASILLITCLAVISLVMYWIFDISIATSFLAVSGAGVLTYIAGSSAGVRLLKLNGLQKLLPWASLVTAVVIMFFIGYVILVSVATFLLSLIYTKYVTRIHSENQ